MDTVSRFRLVQAGCQGLSEPVKRGCRHVGKHQLPPLSRKPARKGARGRRDLQICDTEIGFIQHLATDTGNFKDATVGVLEGG